MGIFCAFGALTGCAHAVVDAFDDQSSIVQDAGKDAKTPPKDAAPAIDSSTVADTSVVDLPDTSLVCSPKFTTGIQQCDSCMAASCCPEDNACANSSQCKGLITCYNTCVPNDGGPPDPNCMSQCDSTYPQGASLLNAWGQCMQTNCSNNCR